jgi:hypothetical protein
MQVPDVLNGNSVAQRSKSRLFTVKLSIFQERSFSHSAILQVLRFTIEPSVISFRDRFHPRVAIAAPRFPTPIQPDET